MRRLPDGSAVHTVEHPSGNLTALVTTGPPPPDPVRRDGTVAWYVPYTRVHERTVAGAPRDAIWIDVRSSPIAYYAAVHEIWERGETFALLEHDVVCRPDVVQAFEECPEPWCVFKRDDYCHPECQEAWANQLSCTRFRKELIETVPDAVSGMPLDRWDWHNMCDGLGDALRAAGFSHHWHDAEVVHHRMGRA